jgi:aspartyl protease family protein
MRLLPCLGAAWLAAAPVASQTVSLGGSLGDKALLVINGTPHTLAAGSAVEGVRLIGVSGGSAVVDIKGQRITLLLGGAQINPGAAAGRPGAGGTQIVLAAGSGGHFLGRGAINGKAVSFMVDTGATNVSLSQAEADRLGLDYRHGQRGLANTANGQVTVYRVQLDSVRVGDVQVYNITATVLPMSMPQVLLGNSFLGHFQMKQENDMLTLTKRF